MLPRRLTRIVLPLAVALTATAGWTSYRAASEEAAVRVALDHYLKGHATGQPAHFQAAFHPEAKLFWVKDGQLMQRTSAEYIAGAKGSPAADEAQRKRRILSVDVAGTAAIAKVELDYPTTRFIDYMSLLKVGSEWKIVNKTFVSEPRTK